jgi:hypothetical protein
MKPGPPLRFWHRTRRRPSFWLGLFVACFLGWAWWESHYSYSEMALSGRGQVLRCVRKDGETSVYWFKDPPSRDFDLNVTRTDFVKRRIFPTTSDINWLLASPSFKTRDSLVFFSFVGLWVGWLAFPAWLRKKRSNSFLDSAENS